MNNDELDEITTRRFECIKLSTSQNKDGFKITLLIQPDDVPPDLMRDYVATRYSAVLVRIDVNEEPQRSKEMVELNRTVQQAGMMCREEEFQIWMTTIGLASAIGEEETKEALYKHLGITSRAELKTNQKARKSFLDLVSEFKDSFR